MLEAAGSNRPMRSSDEGADIGLRPEQDLDRQRSI
jgi:hypothetical protein